jgi:hypothetical protein
LGVKFRTFLLAALIGLGSFHLAEAGDPRATKRKVQPASKYRSPNNKIPKQKKPKKYKAPKQKRVKYKRK